MESYTQSPYTPSWFGQTDKRPINWFRVASKFRSFYFRECSCSEYKNSYVFGSVNATDIKNSYISRSVCEPNIKIVIFGSACAMNGHSLATYV
jgi:hypothetical protein